ncbi:replication-relaxation family protein [Streptomonospora sp. S1-112]|uniref:Replication-relaxation family protein n=1 Tax=Streptomonospora mangrovi TaxID=2883123 RepID=A0A9X3NKX9_9ACTN|nr:replication-relaxation family protein [Streptomonospora mangrovi]MDA0564880.1 replication-relaxation family protein [Streptomonospora mangrovi]
MSIQPTEPVEEARLADLARLLTNRDRAIVADLGDHRVMTTHHLTALHFARTHPSRARRRLAFLHRLGVLDRFRPRLALGTAPWHWVLAAAGEHVYADIHELPEPAQRPGSRIRLAHSARLAHTLGLSACYTAFRTAERAAPGAALLRWRTEADCARRWGRHIRPDAYLLWAQDGRELGAFLEYDTGTERHAQLLRKIRGYTDHAAAYQRTTHVLFVVATRVRLANLAQVLAPHTGDRVDIHLTTETLLHQHGPAHPIWTPAPTPHEHLRLSAIGTHDH